MIGPLKTSFLICQPVWREIQNAFLVIGKWVVGSPEQGYWYCFSDCSNQVRLHLLHRQGEPLFLKFCSTDVYYCSCRILWVSLFVQAAIKQMSDPASSGNIHHTKVSLMIKLPDKQTTIMSVPGLWVFWCYCWCKWNFLMGHQGHKLEHYIAYHHTLKHNSNTVTVKSHDSRCTL